MIITSPFPILILIKLGLQKLPARGRMVTLAYALPLDSRQFACSASPA
jgi:hypothetical protein